MAVEFLWQLPTSGDGRYGNATRQRRGERSTPSHPYSKGITDPRGLRFNYFDYLHQVARAADISGFDGIRIPENPNGDEPWIVAGYVARGTRHLKLLTEFEASRGSSVYAAKNAVSFQRFVNGRFAWQISSNSNSAQRRALGDFAGDEDQLPRIEEFVTVARGVSTQAPYSFKGKYFEVLEGGFRGPLANHRLPPVYLSGDTEESYRLSAKIADFHVLDVSPLNEIEKKVQALKELANKAGRLLEVGLRIDIIARETEQEAVFDAKRYWDQITENQGGEEPLIAQQLWTGLSTSTTGANATLVGSYEQVTQALVDYFNAGVSSFLLSSVPHLEEAYRVGEYVLPIVRSKISPDQRQVA